MPEVSTRSADAGASGITVSGFEQMWDRLNPLASGVTEVDADSFDRHKCRSGARRCGEAMRQY